ncbi:MAG: alpha/beta family hydrolase [Actinomycetota bacterium]
MSDDSEPTQPESITITAPDGVELEAMWAAPAAPKALVVACHPHPLYGGTMEASVPSALFRSLRGHETAVLRFNFRGVGRSQGSHDEGRAERLDVVAAVDAMAERWPDRPVVLAGYSFGADVALAVDHPRIAAWLAVAPPLRVVPIEEMTALADPRPVRVLTGEADQYRPPNEAQELLAPYPTVSVTMMERSDHFNLDLMAVERTAAELAAAVAG